MKIYNNSYLNILEQKIAKKRIIKFFLLFYFLFRSYCCYVSLVPI